MRSERDIEVVLGAHNVHIPEERRVISAVSQYTLAPRYDPNTNGEDVALLQLRDTIDFTDTIMPVCLPKQHDPLPEDVFCYISGWGSTVYGGSASYTLRVVDVNILDEGYCDMNPQTKSNSFCAGHKEGKKDACQGDSGGPLVCFINDHFVLYGITSYGTDCGKSQKAGVYSKVAEYIDWIREQSRIPEDTFNPYE